MQPVQLPACRAGRIAFALLLCSASIGLAQQTITPSMIAAHGLSVRADTVDGFAGGKDAASWFGSYVYAVARTTIAGKPAYLVTTNYTSKEQGTFQSDTSALDAASLAPLWRRFHARTDSASVTFVGGRATGWSLQNDRRVILNHQLSETSFGGPLLRWIFPALPLAVGYRATLSVFSIWKNADDQAVLSVSKQEPVDVGGKRFDAWVAEVPNGSRIWVEKSTGRVVQIFSPDSRRGSWLVKR